MIPRLYAPSPRRFVPSGAIGDAPVLDNTLVPTITENAHATPSPIVRRYQRNLLGIGFAVGTKGADGIPGPETMRAVETFARAWNSDPSLKGSDPNLTVDRLLTPEKQRALQKFDATASDQLTSRVTTSVVSVTPPAPLPWGTIVLAGTAGAAVLGLIVYAINDSSKKKAARS
jgi:peptidoglycan hydrolase-like protein with peptidoglycan-binding domain